MDSFELTKIAGAVLAALLLIFGVKTVVEMGANHGPEKIGYALPGGEAPATEDVAKEGEAPATEAKPADEKAAAAKPADAKPADAKPADAKAADAKPADAKPAAAAPAAGGGNDVLALLAKASADNGKALFSKCKACHVNEKGKASTVGPNLWGVVNRPKASYEGFNYSEAMKAKGGEWSFENLSAFLKNPKGYVAGTKMVFGGIKDPAEEADIIAYLATLADTPVPLPK